MSSRPPGPSSRPLSHFQIGRQQQQHLYAPLVPNNLSFSGHEPPRLKERSCISRLLFCASSMACVLITCLGIHAAVTGYIPSSSLLFRENEKETSMHPKPSREKRNALKKSVIQRMSMLKRSQTGNGVDLKWAKQLFPHWFITHEESENEKLTLDVQSTLSDVLLAMSFLIQAELTEVAETSDQPL